MTGRSEPVHPTQVTGDGGGRTGLLARGVRARPGEVGELVATRGDPRVDGSTWESVGSRLREGEPRALVRRSWVGGVLAIGADGFGSLLALVGFVLGA